MRIFVSGPSGVGKSTIIKSILDNHRDIILSVSFTTRQPRPGEIEGQDYFFINGSQFDTMIKNDLFLEWANVHTDKYGTSFKWVDEKESQGFSILFDIDVQGVKQAKAKGISGCFIMILPPGLKTLEERLIKRGSENGKSLEVRLNNAKTEMSHWRIYDYLVINDNLEKAIIDTESIITAYGCSRDMASGRIEWLQKTE